MPTHLLSRHRHKPRPALPVMAGIALEHGRLHEACGPARHRFALWLTAAAAPGAVLWLPAPHGGHQLNPDGLADLASPARLLFVQTSRSEDQLWVMEESLRSGAVALAVAEVNELPGMTAVRRLHLAAENGGHRDGGTGAAPLGLLLSPGEGGAQGIESRWHLAPAHHLTAASPSPAPQPQPPTPQKAAPPAPPTGAAAADPATGARSRLHSCWHLQRLRARTLPPRQWHIIQAGRNAPLIPHPPSMATAASSLSGLRSPCATAPFGPPQTECNGVPAPGPCQIRGSAQQPEPA